MTSTEQTTEQTTIRGFELLETIGKGGFGVVYRAYQPLVAREVAIKIIVPEHANNPNFIRRFESEAQLVARLEHPYIVPLFDYWRDPDGAYLVMRYLRGGNLRKRMKASPLSTHEVLRLVDQIGDALATAHRSGVVHLDLKPDNILFDGDGNAYLSDFGISKLIKEQRPKDLIPDESGENVVIEQTNVSGSPYYMAPEQIRNEGITPRTDIYSFSILLYEILTGQVPFEASNPMALAVRHLRTPLPDVRTQRPDLPEAITDVLRCAAAKDPADRFADVDALADALRAALSSNTSRPVPVVTVNPYKGLRPFAEADAADFYGRDGLIADMLDLLRGSSFLAVVGPSGSGKSSVVKAGLIPSIRRGEITGSDRWFIAEMTPGNAPMDRLQTALLSIATQSADLGDVLRTQGLTAALDRLIPADERVLLVIDQFEEVFTLTTDESERVQFLKLLHDAADPHGRLMVVITLRADFYDKPLLYEGFGSLVSAHTKVVLPMTTAELESSILRPAERVGLIVEPDLLAAMVADVAEEPGALPLLQYALTELFNQRDGNTLTLKVYRESGGVQGALARRAEELCADLSADRLQSVQQVFLRLITLGEGTEDTRRRARLSELLSVDPDSRANTQAVLDTFGAYRLLSFDHDPATREPTVEVAHEALIRHWARLREWLHANRDEVRMQRSLSQAAREWLDAGREPSFKLRGARLAQFEGWIANAKIALSDDERQFLQESIHERQQEAVLERERQQRELELAQQRAEAAQRAEKLQRIAARRLAGLLIVAVLLVIGLAALSAAVSSARENVQNEANLRATQQMLADARADEAEALWLASEANTLHFNTGSSEQIALLTLRSLSLTNTVQGDRMASIARTLRYPDRVFSRDSVTSEATIIASVNTSSDGNLLAAGIGSRIVVWDIVEDSVRLTIDNGGTFEGEVVTGPRGDKVVFSPDDRVLAAADIKHRVRFWDAQTGDPLYTPLTIPVPEGELIHSIAFSPDGSRLMVDTFTGIITVWDVRSGELVTEIGGDTTYAYEALWVGENVYAVDGDYVLHEWDSTTGEIIGTHDAVGVITVYDISPDGEWIATDEENIDTRMIEILSIEDGSRRALLTGHTDPVISAKFSPDGERLVTSSWDGTTRVWDADTGEELHHYSQPSTLLESGFIPGMDHPFAGHIFSVTDNGLINLWSTAEAPPQFRGHTQLINTGWMSADGQQLATGAWDGNVILWDAQGQAIRTFETEEAIAGIAVSEDEQWITAIDLYTVYVWNLQTGELLTEIELDEEYFTTGEESAIIASDGKSILIDLTTVVLHMDLESGELIREYSAELPDPAPAFSDFYEGIIVSEDARTIFSYRPGDGSLIVIDAATGETVRTLPNVGGAPDILRVSPDGRWLAIAGDGRQLVEGGKGNVLLLYDMETERIVWEGTHSDSLSDLRFSPDSQMLLTGSYDETAVLWDVATGTRIRTLFTSITPRVVFFSPDGDTLTLIQLDGTVRREPVRIERIMQELCGMLRRDFLSSERELYNVPADARTCP
jgi:serine/threonine protein kinase/WD40 repeat protein